MKTDNPEDEVVLRKRLAYLIHEVLSGSMTPDDAVAELLVAGQATDESVTVEHALLHYRDDSSIRSQDPAYCRSQTDGLRAMAEQLASGQPLERDAQYYWRR